MDYTHLKELAPRQIKLESIKIEPAHITAEYAERETFKN